MKKTKKKPARKQPGTALVRRQVTVAAPPVLIDSLAQSTVLGEEAVLGALGLVEIKLTDLEETILSKPVNPARVLIKPTGQPYLSHPEYTKWFNDAFGRLGWAIVPKAKPRMADKTISCPYVLYIHGKPAAFALGEQEYYESNREQTYGDAYEATVASALRRCAKRLGVGLELWDKVWLNRFITEECVKVWRGDDKKPAWRRRDDPPFWDERPGKAGAPPAEPRPAASAYHAQSTEPITDGQRRRLFAIATHAGRGEIEIKAWLLQRYRIDSTRKIPRNLYDEICKAIEGTGPLDIVDPREPGQEG